MSRSKRPPGGDQPSIAYRWKQVQGLSLGRAGYVREKHAPTVSQTDEQHNSKTEPGCPRLASTTELISAVGQVWNHINPPPVSDASSKLNQNGNHCRRSISLSDLGGKEVSRAPILNDEGEYFGVDTTRASHFTVKVQPRFEFVKVTQKLSAFERRVGNSTLPFFWPISSKVIFLSNEYLKEKGLWSIHIPHKLENRYAWMKDILPAKSHYSVTNLDKGKGSKIHVAGSKTTKIDGCMSEATFPDDNFALKRTSFSSNQVESDNALGFTTAEASALSSDFLSATLQYITLNASVTKASSCMPFRDYSINVVAPDKYTFAKFRDDFVDNEVRESTQNQHQKFVAIDKKEMQISSSTHERPHYPIARQEHAFAGAFAGTFVSLCLHPVDTIKTVLQSCRINQKSIWCIGRSIIAERGVIGLYRGLASNIASSAPISAIYTCTYESVKGVFLPFLSKEYHSFAHCIAGGCASVATSFVFTPSEHVKQQMQIGSHYRNCWNALLGIIGKGGLYSLYAGWGAVLCRNVPHSIIKFYTYESLKGLMLPSESSSGLPNTLQTLVCGGIAGSTAALFTTPFDVVKTRLQTQIPGSSCQYNSVFQALQDISKHEGLKGLYRGLVPRVLMYMSQGALFFTSYECFKRLFSLEAHRLDVRRMMYEKNSEDD